MADSDSKLDPSSSTTNSKAEQGGMIEGGKTSRMSGSGLDRQLHAGLSARGVKGSPEEVSPKNSNCIIV